METLDSIRERLIAVRGRWPWISERSGVPYPTLVKFAQGVTVSPGFDTIKAIDDALIALAVLNSTANADGAKA